MRTVLSIWILALTAASASPLGGLAAAEGFAARTHSSPAGKTLPYRLLVPPATAAGKVPIVLFLHGAGERGADNEAQLKHVVGTFATPASREKFPCFVVAPQCPPGEQWVEMDWAADAGTRPERPSAALGLALEIVDSLAKDPSADPDRIYVAGLSMGGFGAWDCVTRFPDRFAAAVPICGGGDPKTVDEKVARVPVWAFHSSDDGVVKPRRTREMVRAFEEKGGKPRHFEYRGLGHNSWDKAFAEPEILPWLFAQRRGKPDAYALRTRPPEPLVARFPDDAEFPGKGPIRKADWFRNLWRELRTQWWKDRDRDVGAVVFLGDSITQGWGDLAKDFPGMKVANRGISGDVTRGVLYRLKEDVTDLRPRAVVLLIGTNDLEDGGAPEAIAENVKAIVLALKAQDPKMPVIACKVMPSHADMRRPAEKIKRINDLVDAVLEGEPQCLRCDTHSVFADSEGNAKRAEFPDLLHPNEAGYAKWAAALRPIFLKLGIDSGKP